MRKTTNFVPIFALLFLMLTLSSCFNPNNNLRIENVPIIGPSNYSGEEIQILLEPFNIFVNDKRDTINIGKILNGKMTIIFPKHIDNKYLLDPAETGYTVSKGHKIMPFCTRPYIQLTHTETNTYLCALDYIIYSNKNGKMTRDKEEIILKKGWNIYKDIGENEKVNLKKLFKQDHLWYYFFLD
jgi:hypothetical protein